MRIVTIKFTLDGCQCYTDFRGDDEQQALDAFWAWASLLKDPVSNVGVFRSKVDE